MSGTKLELYKVKELSDALVSTERSISICGRIHDMRTLGSMMFIIVRDQIYSIQCVYTKKSSVEKFKQFSAIPKESFVIITGFLSKLPVEVKRIEYTSHKDFEFRIESIVVTSTSTRTLPLTLDDVTHSHAPKNDRNDVMLYTRLNNRSFDLRTPFSNSIFRIQSGVCQLFREHLTSKDFMEIHSPKIIGTPSEGGAAVFNVNYFDKSVFLAQSPQLYKQMAINSDFERVFEIGPIFRAENCISYRHLCEFVGLDIEMALSAKLDSTENDYYEIIEIFWGVLVYVFNHLETCTKYKNQVEYVRSINKSSSPLIPSDPLIIDFKEGVRMLNEAGYEQNEMDDLSSQNEKKLGDLVKEKYNSDLFVLDKYPLNVRPFYTMPTLDGKYSKSYDVIFRGQEISSGSQRIHDYDMLLQSVESKGLNPEYLQHYLDSFKYGARPHGGCGFGLERIVTLFLDLGNVRESSLYPRDSSRITP